MGSDNGKAGVVDFYDITSQMLYLEEHYNGSVELNLSTASFRGAGVMLLCASFVGSEPRPARIAGSTIEIPRAPGIMRELPRLAHELLFELQEAVDDLKPGEAKLAF